MRSFPLDSMQCIFFAQPSAHRERNAKKDWDCTRNKMADGFAVRPNNRLQHPVMPSK